MLVPFQRKYLPYSERDYATELRQWFASEAGTNVLRAGVTAIEGILPDLFGYHLVLYGDWVDKEIVSSSRISHRIILGTASDSDSDLKQQATVISDTAALPLAENSIDVLVVPHILEFADDPHQLLREAERVLIGEGYIVLLCFNPWSLFGLWRGLLRWRDVVPWRGGFISQSRIKDWLRLLGFDIRKTAKVGFRPPLQRPRLNRKLEFLEYLGAFCWPVFGNVSVVVAKKRVASFTPLKTSWETRRRLVGGGVVEPTARRPQDAKRITTSE